MIKDQIYLRLEANSIANESLSKSQLDAFKQIIQSLYETVEDLNEAQKKGRNSSQFGVDSDRKSRTMMISGDRGTGKTTLMLTLQNQLMSGIIDENLVSTLGVEFKQHFTTVKNRIVWLDPLDMERSEEDTNLFVSILTQFDAAIERCFTPDRSERFPQGAMVSPFPGSDDMLIELRRLQIDASLAWEGNLRARAPSLDPDAYATEVIRAERARMGLNKRFRKLLDDLAIKLNWGPKVNDPIFLLAIDDFDLTPTRSLDILKLVRSLNAPRFFTLLLGDEDVAEEVFRLEIQGSMSRIANVTINTCGATSSSFIRRIKHISPQAVRKLVPPHQRIRLKHNTIEQSLKVKPENAVSSLGAILKAFHLYAELPNSRADLDSSNQENWTLHDFLVTSFPDFMLRELNAFGNETSQNIRTCHYKGGRILETTLREVIDIWFAIKRINESVSDDPTGQIFEKKNLLISEVRNWLCKAAYDDPLLDMEFAEWLILEFEGESNPDRFSTYNLELVLPFSKNQSIETDLPKDFTMISHANLSVKLIDEYKLVLNRLPEFDQNLSSGTNRVKNCEENLRENFTTNRTNETQSSISTKTQAHITLLHDLIATNPAAPITGDYLVKPLGLYDIVTCEWRVGGNWEASVPWRGAIFRTIRELEIFSNTWNLFIEKIQRKHTQEHRPNVDVMATAWYIINITTLLGLRTLPEDLLFDSVFSEEPDQKSRLLDFLVDRLLKLTKSPEVGRSRAVWTLEGLLSNIFPGSGFSTQFCRRILSLPGINNFYKTNLSRINRIHSVWVDTSNRGSRELRTALNAPHNFFMNISQTAETYLAISGSDDHTNKELKRDVTSLIGLLDEMRKFREVLLADSSDSDAFFYYFTSRIRSQKQLKVFLSDDYISDDIGVLYLARLKADLKYLIMFPSVFFHVESFWKNVLSDVKS